MEEVLRRISNEIVFRKLVLGITNKDIAKVLECSDKTVGRKISNIGKMTIEELLTVMKLLQIDSKKKGELFDENS